jgi:hypothetical protein
MASHRRRSVPSAPPLPYTGPGPAERNLLARLHSNATYKASAMGYRLLDMRAYEMLDPSRGVAWFRLTFGNVVVWADGLEEGSHWSATLEAGAQEYAQTKDRIGRVGRQPDVV